MRQVVGSVMMLLLLVGCAAGEEEPAAPSQAEHAPHQDDSLHASGLRLNEGHKWPVDEHTRAMFRQMSDTIGEAPGSLDEAHALGARLQGQLGELIAGCTMTGEAHDQLHVLLVDLMPAVKTLAEEEDEEEVHLALAHVETLLEDYSTFFE